ncbi:MAG: CARDB domain-containing protein, partial [Thermoanaerobaculum sp.]
MDAAGRAVRPTPDGGFVVAGWIAFGSSSNADAWVLKFDSSGTLQWQKAYGGSGKDRATSIEPTSDGGYIVGGTTGSFGTVADSTDYNLWVFKLDGAGNLQWQRFFDLPQDVDSSVDQIVRVVPVQGGYLVAGEAWNIGAGKDDTLLIKLDNGGNVVWQRTVGGSEWESAWDVRATTDGGAIVAGHSWSVNVSDYWLLKLDASGALQWQKGYTGHSVQEEHATSVVLTNDGGYLVVGWEDIGAIWYLSMLKLAADGTLVWQKKYEHSVGRLVPRHVQFNSISTGDITIDGYIVAGWVTDTVGTKKAWLAWFDTSGNVVWSKAYRPGPGTKAEFWSAVPYADGSVYVAVGNYEPSPWDPSQLWVVGVDLNGNLGAGCLVEDLPLSPVTSFPNAYVTTFPESAQFLPNATDPPTLTPTALVPRNPCAATTSADMQANAPTVPPSLAPGGNYNLSFSCTNNGPDAATNASCSVAVSAGVASGVNCSPSVPVSSLPSGGTISCTYTFTAPGTPGGGDTPETGITFTVTASSSTSDPNSSNNTATSGATPVPIVDAVNDSASFPANTSQTFNLAGNDQ